MPDNTSKIALVTGGSRGLGKDMALRIAEKGIDVIITWRSQEQEAEAVVTAIQQLNRKAVALQLDLAEPGAVGRFMPLLKNCLRHQWNTDHFDFLINNAGMGATVPFMEVSESLFDEFMNVHFKDVYFLTQQCAPLLNNGGRVINISSGTARFCNPGYSVYASMKGAIEVFTRYVAKELGERGITANVVAPGPIETDFNSAAIRNNPQMKTRLSGLSPLGRVGNAEDIGGVVAFLCTEDARWINSQRIEVSGGINS